MLGGNIEAFRLTKPRMRKKGFRMLQELNIERSMPE